MLERQRALTQEEKINWQEKQFANKGTKHFEFPKSQDKNLLV